MEFAHSVGETVRLVPLGIKAMVDSLRLDQNGTQYGVVYWNDGVRVSTWVYGWEVEKYTGDPQPPLFR